MEKSAADAFFLPAIPHEWTRPCDLQIRRPRYRCERLYRLGLLDRKINPAFKDRVIGGSASYDYYVYKRRRDHAPTDARLRSTT